MKFGVFLSAQQPRSDDPVERFRETIEQARLEAMLRELHRAGVLDDEELEAKLGRLTATTEEK